MDISLLFITALTTGIIFLKIAWFITDPNPLHDKFNKEHFKSNFIETTILLLQVLSVLYFPLPKTPWDDFIIITGLTLYGSGIILVLWARIVMKENWGHPGKHIKERQKELVTAGPFSFSRNPIYLGWIFIYFGYALAIKTWLIVLRIPLVIYFHRSAIQEEKNLEKQFGKQYVEYKSRVPRFLFI